MSGEPWVGPDAIVANLFVWTLAGGKITRFQQYTDTGQFQDAMGARPRHAQ